MLLQKIREYRQDNKVDTAVHLVHKFESFFENDVEFLEEAGLCNFYYDNFASARRLWEKAIAQTPNKRLLDFLRILQNRANTDENPVPQVQKVKILLTMTSCKRYDLFERTVNSFLKNCLDKDLITSWFCVDDDSSKEDRSRMETNFPFITFFMKQVDMKGHGRSMNLIRNVAADWQADYIFHLEDDFEFLVPMRYMTALMQIITRDNRYGQVLVNKNSTESLDELYMEGGIRMKTSSGIHYLEHGVPPEGEVLPSSSYWPHFSLRPSLISVNMLQDIGPFIEHGHFEIDYAHRYVTKGYKSAYLDGIFCEHIGRKTSDHSHTKPNAYELNKELQFVPSIEYVVINLERRSDRLKKFHLPSCHYRVFTAIDGQDLEPNLDYHELFRNNTKDMTHGIIGCALSHISVWKELAKNFVQTSVYCIFEDDALVRVHNFDEISKNIVNRLTVSDWDIVFLGHSSKETQPEDTTTTLKVTECKTTLRSIEISMGGMFGYLIKHTAIPKIFKYLSTYGMTNALDTVVQKCIDEGLKVYYTQPMIVTSPLAKDSRDSDIQFSNEKILLPEDKVSEKLDIILPPKSVNEFLKAIQEHPDKAVGMESNVVLPGAFRIGKWCIFSKKFQDSFLK
jgi:GR25 family glycosyltransferase involved in LPS biosynthesis